MEYFPADDAQQQRQRCGRRIGSVGFKNIFTPAAAKGGSGPFGGCAFPRRQIRYNARRRTPSALYLLPQFPRIVSPRQTVENQFPSAPLVLNSTPDVRAVRESSFFRERPATWQLRIHFLRLPFIFAPVSYLSREISSLTKEAKNIYQSMIDFPSHEYIFIDV